MSSSFKMNFFLNENDDENGYFNGSAHVINLSENTQQVCEILFRKRSLIESEKLEWGKSFVLAQIYRFDKNKVTFHPTLISQLILIFLGVELVFHRDNQDEFPDAKFHSTGFHYNMLFDTFSSLISDKTDIMKPARKFKGQTLKGLWYKHVQDASISGMATNILSEMSRGNWLMQSFVEKFGPLDGSTVFGDEHSAFLAKKVTEGALSRRSNRNEMTGEWLVYSKEEEKLHLFTLASHQEDDNRIIERIWTI